MAKTDLTADKLRETLNYDPQTGVFSRLADSHKGRWKAGSQVGWLSNTGYLRIEVCGCAYLAHRLAWLYTYGQWPSHEVVHIDKNKSNNAVSNLRGPIQAGSDISAKLLRELLFYDPETGIFVRLVDSSDGSAKAGDIAGYDTGQGYIALSLLGRRYQAHRLAWLTVYGGWPKDQIDHIDGNRSNNAIANLREASHKTNRQNLHAAHHDNKSGLLGVSFDKRRNLWISQICSDGKNKHIGRYATKEMAHAAYLSEKRKLHAFCTI